MKIQGISQSNPYYSYIHGRKNNLIEAYSKEQKQTLKVKEKQPMFLGIKNLIFNASPIKKTFLFSLLK